MKKLNWELIRGKWEEGKKDREIAEELSTHTATICLIRKRLGLKTHHRAFILKEIEKNRIVFRKHYPTIIRKLICNEEKINAMKLRKIMIPRILMPRGISNLKKEVIYCKLGDEEKAYEEYMKQIPKQTYNYIKLLNQKTRSLRLNYIRKFFGLKRLNGIKI